jgi:hypothetical protein
MEYRRRRMIDELYGAATIIGHLQHNGVWYKDVEVEWVYIDRIQPIAPYATLIADYAQLGQPERVYAEQYMDELFTDKEYHTLRRYLEEHHGLVASMSVVPIPMEVQPESVGFMATPALRMVEVDQSGQFGWYTLNGVEGTLPFKVAAWYFVGNSMVTDTGP